MDSSVISRPRTTTPHADIGGPQQALLSVRGLIKHFPLSRSKYGAKRPK